MFNLDELDPERTCVKKSECTDSLFNNVECLERIFSYFSNDVATLFKCVLVNRFWCRVAVPLLWSNPFEFVKLMRYEHGWQIIRTYLTCLPDNEKKIVNKWILPSDLQKALFDYPKFLKCLDTSGFQEAMTKWKRYNWKTVWERLGHFDLDKAIGDILFRRCNGLDGLYIIYFAYTQNIAYFSEPSNALTKLQTCKIIHDLQGRYYNYVENREQVTLLENFRVITKFAHSIRYLEISLPENRVRQTGLCLLSLLERQQNLEELVVREFWDRSDTSVLLETLKLQHNHLRSVSFIRLTHFHEKLFDLLSSCPKLEILRFLEPDIRTFPTFNIPSFDCNLKNFCVWGKPMISQFIINPDVNFELDIVRSIIESSASTLTKLALGTFTKSLCTTILQCTKLKFLAVQAKEDISSLFPQYLLGSDLTELVLFGKHKNYFNRNTLLKFANSLPPSLYNLDLLLEILPKDLEFLLDNCFSPLEKISLHHQQNILEQNVPQFLTTYVHKSRTFLELRYLIDNRVGEIYLDPIMQALNTIPKIKIVLGKNNFYPFYFQDTGYF